MSDLFALTDLCTPWCVHVVVTLGVADHLASAPLPAERLAPLVGADADALARVLRHLVGHGIFEEPAPGVFAMTGAGRALLEPAVRLGLDLHGIGGRMAHAWSGLLEAVRTGRPAYGAIFGRSFWDDLDANPEIAASFDALMGPEGHGAPDPEILPRSDWDDVRTVVDVGGGTGTLLAAILRARPSLRGTLVDRPATVTRSAAVFDAADVRARAEVRPQSFFDPLPAGADVYVLNKVLADWPDREATAILARCADAARPNGRIVVIGGVSPEETPSPELLMLVLVGGRSRTLAQFREIARAAGLDVRATGRQPSGRFVVECTVAGR